MTASLNELIESLLGLMEKIDYKKVNANFWKEYLSSLPSVKREVIIENLAKDWKVSKQEVNDKYRKYRMDTIMDLHYHRNL